MAETKQLRFEMRADETFVRAVDDWRRKQEDVPPRAELGLKKVPKRKRPKKKAPSVPQPGILRARGIQTD
jgi:hypothetical protein